MLRNSRKQKHNYGKVHVKTGDNVILIRGKDKGKIGKVIAVSPKEGKLMVEGVHVVTKHVKPKKQGQQGGIVKTESAFYACKVKLVCPKCKAPTKIAHMFTENQKKVRKCKKCSEAIDLLN